MRVRQLTTPRVVDQANTFIVETHAYPSFSSNGQRLAFFRITFPSPFLTQPAQADLIVIDVNTGAGDIVAGFDPGNYPLGVSWSDNDQLIYFAAGQQVSQNGQFRPLAIASTARIFTVSPNGGAIAQVPGVASGYFPNAMPLVNRVFGNGFER